MADNSENARTHQPADTANPALKRLSALVGEWTLGGGPPVDQPAGGQGRVVFEWLDGGHFLVQRWEIPHPDAPNGIAIIGCDDSSEHCTMHYFDSRGVARVYQTDVRDGVWTQWRDVPGFSQRFNGTFSDDGNTIAGRWELSTDDLNWEHDFDLTYERVT